MPLLTYLLTKEELTPMEVNGHAIDVVAAAVDNVSNNCDKVTSPKTNYFEVLCTVMQISLQEK